MNISSNQRNTWRKLARNKAALCGMLIIMLSVLVAIFAYFISPDSTPDANRMIIETGGKNPGFTQLFLKIKRDTAGAAANDAPGFFHRLLYGQKDVFDYLPIISYAIANDTLIVQKYIDEGIGEPLFFPLKGRKVNIEDGALSGNNVTATNFEKDAAGAAMHLPDTFSSSSTVKDGSSSIIKVGQDVNSVNKNSTSSAISDTPANIKSLHANAGKEYSTTNPTFEIEKIHFVLGTDKYGRDILSRLLIGVRVSLGVGLVAVALSLSIGILLGSLAGYYRGRIDDVIMWFINVIWSIPTLLLVFAITLLLGKGFWQVFIAIGLTTWVNVARLIRGQVLSIRNMEYVEAARALGFTDTRIIIRHILPNTLGPVIVIAASNFASAIVIEAGLSFLGVGVQSPQPSWGLMIKENYNFIITHNPMLALAPGFAIMILVLAFNMLGNGLRDALQVKA